MKTEEKTRLEIRRVINAPRDRVYATWTDPAQLKQWFGPENVQTRDMVFRLAMRPTQQNQRSFIRPNEANGPLAK